MQFKRFNIQACCGKTSIIYQLNKSISADFISFFEGYGFGEMNNFTKAGILYLQGENFILTGAFGSDKLQVKCRKSNCEQYLSELENIFNILN